ncbi:YceI family protein [Persicitalea sp.]|uniref:YceI family protein n=1 Tax=Persicitalea sp. TaxID=3100273 RepID=UPI0035943B75
MALSIIFPSSEILAQSKLYATTSGQTSFHSSTPAEDINAVNKKTQVLLNTATGEMAVLMSMRDFDFPNELMEEHFNENYMESEKYPKATFKGKLDQPVDFSKNGSYQLSASGTFTVHGVSQPRKLNGTLSVQNERVSVDAKFDVALVDHKIEVPKIVFVKIAQVIEVRANYDLVPYKK